MCRLSCSKKFIFLLSPLGSHLFEKVPWISPAVLQKNSIAAKERKGCQGRGGKSSLLILFIFKFSMKPLSLAKEESTPPRSVCETGVTCLNSKRIWKASRNGLELDKRGKKAVKTSLLYCTHNRHIFAQAYKVISPLFSPSVICKSFAFFPKQFSHPLDFQKIVHNRNQPKHAA